MDVKKLKDIVKHGRNVSILLIIAFTIMGLMKFVFLVCALYMALLFIISYKFFK